MFSLSLSHSSSSVRFNDVNNISSLISNMSRSIYLHDDNTNSWKGSSISYIFAHGFDEFATTWPPSTNITIIKNDKETCTSISA